RDPGRHGVGRASRARRRRLAGLSGPRAPRRPRVRGPDHGAVRDAPPGSPARRRRAGAVGGARAERPDDAALTPSTILTPALRYAVPILAMGYHPTRLEARLRAQEG